LFVVFEVVYRSGSGFEAVKESFCPKYSMKRVVLVAAVEFKVRSKLEGLDKV